MRADAEQGIDHAERGTAHTDEGGGHPVAAFGVVIVSYSAAAAAILLYLLNRPTWTSDQWYFVVDLADGLVYAPVAAILLMRVRRTVAWLVALTAVGGSFAALGFQWGQLRLARADVAQLDTLTSMQNWAWIPGTLALITIVPWLVRDDRPDLVARLAIAAGTAVIGFWLLLRLTDPVPWFDGEVISLFPIRNDAWERFIESTFTAQTVVLIVLGLIATADVVRRWSTRSPERRRGLGWLAIGSFLMTVSFVPLALPMSVLELLPVAFTPLMHLSSQLFFPAAVLVVVLGQRLWGIDLAVSRAVSWGLLTAVLTVAYVAVVSVLSMLMPSGSGVQQVVATAFVAAGFQPVKRWVQQRVNHLVHGEAAEPMSLVRRVGRGVGRAGEPQELLDDVVVGVQTSLRLGEVEIVVGDVDGEGPQVLASTAEADGLTVSAPDRVEVPLVIQQRTDCRLVVSPRPGERLDGRSVRSLEELAPIVAAAVQLSATAAELARSRSRLSEARDEERRRLRRELHDGLGPALAGIGLALQASRNLLVTDPDAASRLLEQMVTETDRRVEEVRRMARELLPPTLEADGLVAALTELAELHRANGMPIEVHLGELVDVSSTTATAAYAIASEAVRNVVRHSTATACSITLRDGTDDALVLEVSDNGSGVDGSATPGVGLQSMREWAEGVGGTFELSAAEPTGTRITARIPSGRIPSGAGALT